MLTHLERFTRALRRKLSRTSWAIVLLRLSRLTNPTAEPGLVMVQIDGLSSQQLAKAMERGRAPFLARLLSHEGYVKHPFYSGIPSNTPSVQGEIFYGVKTCVPSFSYVNRQTNQFIRMFDAPAVEAFEPKLAAQGEGLLKGGSSYSNIFTGGAKESHFCWAQLGWSGVIHAINPLVFPFLLLLYVDIFLRTLVLLILEFFIALYECIRGTLRGRMFFEELRFVWLRVLICVFLREVIVAGACMDIIRGLPIIHLNLLGYDEQAHCRGPSSRYAHWAIRGIDSAIKRIHDVIAQSPYRDYDLWVYSDHGQDSTKPYLVKYGCTVEEAIQKLFGSIKNKAYLDYAQEDMSRALLLRRRLKSTAASKEPIAVSNFEDQEAVVTAMGPLGQIYVKKKLDRGQTEFFAKALVSEVKIPLVLTRQEEGKVFAYTPSGVFVLPQQSAEVFGADHPYLSELNEDLIRACWHSDAGEFTIAGWSKGQESISFPIEYGAHAAMSAEETSAFALMPKDAPLDNHKNYLRPLDLRAAAFKHLNKEKVPSAFHVPHISVSNKPLRILSYNVHGCMGMDGNISTDRIGRVIARQNPDIIALQELDAFRPRSKGIDQAHRIAHYLEMKYHFHPVFCRQEEQYGNAILSRHPLNVVKMHALPQLKTTARYEPRGAMWVEFEHSGQHIHVLNTHLSVWPKERVLQIEALLSDFWLGKVSIDTPVIFCGDFNSIPGSTTYRKVCERFKESQSLIEGKPRLATWAGPYPLSQIDHVFVSSQFKVHKVLVPRTRLDTLASDHLPLVVDLSFIPH